MIIIRSPQKSLGNYLVSYTKEPYYRSLVVTLIDPFKKKKPILIVYPKAPKRVLGPLGEGFGFGGYGSGSHNEGPGALG